MVDPSGSGAWWTAGDQFRAGFDAMVDPVVFLSAIRGDDGSIVDFKFEFLNLAARATFRSVSADMISMSLEAAFPTSSDSELFRALCRVVEVGAPLSLEVPWTEKIRGDTRWEVTGSRLGDGCIAAARDLTDRIQTTVELRERELRYRMLADHAGDVATLSERGVIQWVGPSITDLLGWLPDDLVGRTVWSLVHPEDLPAVLEFRSRLTRAKTSKVRVRMAHSDGTYRWMDNSSRLATPAGTDGAVVSVMWSVGAEVEALEALTRAQAERVRLENRMQVAERLESLGVLAGGIAHDFNNLLVGVLGNAELARGHLDDPVVLLTLLDQLVHSAERAAELTRQMLDYAGQRSTPTDPVDVGELVADTVTVISASIAAETNVTIDVESDLPLVSADATQLRQVVMNLVINASESLDGQVGEVTVRVVQRHISEVEATAIAPLNPPRPGAFVVLEVADTGHGMSSETVSKMFEPFFTTGPTGRGIGLSVVHGAVRSLGGAVEVVSTLNVGTVVRVFLPADSAVTQLDPPSEQDLEPAVNPSPLPVTTSSAERTVLVVDDEAVVARMIERALVVAGYRVHTASGPEVGIDLFTQQPDSFSVAVVDVTMPGMNGVAMAAELHAIRPTLPIVLMSGYTAADIGVELTDDRFRFLAKPFRIDALVETVAAAVTGS